MANQTKKISKRLSREHLPNELENRLEPQDSLAILGEDLIRAGYPIPGWLLVNFDNRINPYEKPRIVETKGGDVTPRYVVSYEKQIFELPKNEYKLFYFLSQHPNRVISPTEIIDCVFFGYFISTAGNYVRRLRSKLETFAGLGDRLVTVGYGRSAPGYIFKKEKS